MRLGSIFKEIEEFPMNDHLHYAELSKLVYLSGKFVKRQAPIPFKEFIDIKQDTADSQVGVFQDDALIFAFRGTEVDKAEDILTDLWVKKETFTEVRELGGRMKVHAGFLEAYRVIREDMLKHISKKTKRVVTCGHSLGGALASLAAVDISCNRQIPVTCFTYGSPRAGDGRFAKAFNEHVERSIRLVNGLDPVTFVPLSFMGFKHVKGEQAVGKATWADILSSWQARTSHVARAKLIGKFHEIDSYIEECKKL